MCGWLKCAGDATCHLKNVPAGNTGPVLTPGHLQPHQTPPGLCSEKDKQKTGINNPLYLTRLKKCLKKPQNKCQEKAEPDGTQLCSFQVGAELVLDSSGQTGEVQPCLDMQQPPQHAGFPTNTSAG